MNLLKDARLKNLLSAAVAAPSADNHHPWKLSVGEQGLSFQCPALHDAPQTRWILALISLGAMSESMMIRAAGLGLKLLPQYSLQQREQPLSLLAHEAPCEPDPLDMAIDRRHSNRALVYRGPVLSQQQQGLLHAEAIGITGAALEWLDGSDRRKAAIRLVRQAETARFRHRALHAELFEAIRFDIGWGKTADQGLPPAVLGVARLERPMFSMMRHWQIQRLMNLLGAHRMLGMRGAGLPSRWTPHLCAITAQGEHEFAALQAGRLLQRVWCRATLMGLACQVLAASPIYALPGATAVDPALQRSLAAGWSRLTASGRPFVVIRIGHAAEPLLRTGRPPAESLLASPA